jgi:hypothetical protein
MSGVNFQIEPECLRPLIDEVVTATIEALRAKPAGRPIHPEAEPGRLLLKPREAAELLGISERTLWGITAPRGDLPCVRVGLDGSKREAARFVRYDVKDVSAWIERNKTTPTPRNGQAAARRSMLSPPACKPRA